MAYTRLDVKEEGVALKSEDKYVYFLYSEQQEKKRTELEAQLHRVFIPGTVIVNGRRMNFTELSYKPSNTFTDCKIIAEGWKSKMNYTDVSIR